MNEIPVVSIDDVKNFEGISSNKRSLKLIFTFFFNLDAKKYLRYLRDDNVRRSKDVIDLWDRIISRNIQKFGDESTY
jgi:hypothetical protein